MLQEFVIPAYFLYNGYLIPDYIEEQLHKYGIILEEYQCHIPPKPGEQYCPFHKKEVNKAQKTKDVQISLLDLPTYQTTEKDVQGNTYSVYLFIDCTLPSLNFPTKDEQQIQQPVILLDCEIIGESHGTKSELHTLLCWHTTFQNADFTGATFQEAAYTWKRY